MKLFVTSTLLFSLVLADDRPKPWLPSQCDDARECEGFTLDSYNAKCFGYHGCEKAVITLDNAKCTGDSGCYNTTITGEKALCSGVNGCADSSLQVKYALCMGAYACARSKLDIQKDIACNGYKGCFEAQYINAGGRVSCNGDRACYDVRDPITSGEHVLCDGDKACQNDNIDAGKSVLCAGFKACKNAAIDASGGVYCDGDTACDGVTINARMTRCYGKRVCINSVIKVKELNLYGFMAAAKSRIKAGAVNAMGFNALAGARIVSRVQDGNTFIVRAYGYRAAVGSVIICSAGDDCLLICKGNACKKTKLLCFGDCNVKPEACQNDNSVNQHEGTFCPIWIPKATQQDVEEAYAEQDIFMENDPEMVAILEAMEDEDETYEDIMTEKDALLEVFGEEGDIMDINEESLLFGNISYFVYSHSIYSYLAVAFVATITTFFIVFCYFKAKYKDHMYKSLDNI